MRDDLIIIHRKKPYMRTQCKHCNRFDTSLISEVNIDCPHCEKQNTPARVLQEDPVSVYVPLMLKKFETNMVLELSANDKMYMDLKVLIQKLKNARLGLQFKEVRKKMPLQKKKCLMCGYCMDCIHCTKCDKHYSKTRNNCPTCNTSTTRGLVTYFKEAIRKTPSMKVCPFCQSSNIRHTTFNKELNQCPECNIEVKGKVSEINAHVFYVTKLKMMGVVKKENE